MLGTTRVAVQGWKGAIVNWAGLRLLPLTDYRPYWPAAVAGYY
jgi:hypothetical protein